MTRQNLTDAMASLAERRPVFHSEADFQHELAMEISRTGFGVRLEIPFEVNLNNVHITVELDLLLLNARTKHKTAVEIKYVKSAVTVDHRGERFNLKNTWGTNLPRFDCLADFQRVGQLKAAGIVDSAFTIFLTNSASAWADNVGGTNIMARQFSIHEGREMNAGALLNWVPANPTVGSVSARRLPPYAPINIPQAATCTWAKYSDFQGRNGSFRYLLLEV